MDGRQGREQTSRPTAGRRRRTRRSVEREGVVRLASTSGAPKPVADSHPRPPGSLCSSPVGVLIEEAVVPGSEAEVDVGDVHEVAASVEDGLGLVEVRSLALLLRLERLRRLRQPIGRAGQRSRLSDRRLPPKHRTTVS